MKGMYLLLFGYMTPLLHITDTNKYRKQNKKKHANVKGRDH